MRICYLISTFYPFVGGGETHARLLCRELVRRGVDVFVLTRRTDPRLEAETLVDGVRVYRVPPSGFRRIGKYLMLLPVFFRLIRLHRQYDIILVSGLRLLSIPALLVAKMTGRKCVLRGASCGELSGGFIWDSPHLKNKTVAKGFFRILVRCRNWLLLKADGFLGISEAIRAEYLECGVPDAKIRVINNGTDTDWFRPADAAERSARRVALGVPEKTVLAYAGKLNKGKGLEFLLDVWQDLAARHENVHLLLIGAGGGGFLSCEDTLRATVKARGLAGQVTFTGYVENVNDYLQCADIFVFPSENESLSNALIEALACGLPCLASHVGGIPDTVKDGVNGRLLPVGDKEAWLAAIDELLGDPCLAMLLGRQGRQGVLAHNSMESVTVAHMEYLNSLM